jgi:hypothetical protein
MFLSSVNGTSMTATVINISLHHLNNARSLHPIFLTRHLPNYKVSNWSQISYHSIRGIHDKMYWLSLIVHTPSCLCVYLLFCIEYNLNYYGQFLESATQVVVDHSNSYGVIGDNFSQKNKFIILPKHSNIIMEAVDTFGNLTVTILTYCRCGASLRNTHCISKCCKL